MLYHLSFKIIKVVFKLRIILLKKLVSIININFTLSLFSSLIWIPIEISDGVFVEGTRWYLLPCLLTKTSSLLSSGSDRAVYMIGSNVNWFFNLLSRASTRTSELRPWPFVIITPDVGNFCCRTRNDFHQAPCAAVTCEQSLIPLLLFPWNAHFFKRTVTKPHVHRGAILSPDAGVQRLQQSAVFIMTREICRTGEGCCGE